MSSDAFVSSSILMSNAATWVCPSLTFSNYLSQPVPSLGKSKLLAAFLIGRGEVLNAEERYCIWPPRLLAVFNVCTGGFEELRAISPADFSRKDDPDKPFFSGISPVEKAQAEFLEKQVKLFESFDKLVERLIAKDNYEGELKAYDRTYKGLSEAALIPYYGKLLLQPIEKV